MSMLRTAVAAGFLSLLALAAYAGAPEAGELLRSSIDFHDPEGAWAGGAFRLELEESRPDGSGRRTVLLIDNARGIFEADTAREGRSLRGELTPGGCTWRLDGSTEFSDEEREEFRLTCDRLEWWRNYYVYLWGLPMKLRDPGTILEPEVEATEFEGRPAWAIRVTYEPEVGGDVWYFYFDPTDRSLIGYRFYHDEAANDGEYVVLEGLHEGAGLRLPEARAWFTHQDEKHLGTDTLVSIEALGRD